jgi:hypothetical protein
MFLRQILARRGAIEAPLYGSSASNLSIIHETRRQVPVLLNDAAALQILVCAHASARIGGAMAEAGVLMGGSARLICEAKGGLPLHLFDVFDSLQSAPPEPGSAGAELSAHFGKTCGQLKAVRQLLAPYENVHFHPGIFPDSAADVSEERYSFVHLDLDLRSSTSAALGYFHPRMRPGGILIGDDYDDAAVRDVFAAFFAGKPDTLIEWPWGQVMVVRAS